MRQVEFHLLYVCCKGIAGPWLEVSVQNLITIAIVCEVLSVNLVWCELLQCCALRDIPYLKPIIYSPPFDRIRELDLIWHMKATILRRGDRFPLWNLELTQLGSVPCSWNRKSTLLTVEPSRTGWIGAGSKVNPGINYQVSNAFQLTPTFCFS